MTADEYRKYLRMDDALFDYVAAHTTPPDAVQRQLIERTRELGDRKRMQVAHPQAVFMTFLTRVIGAKNAIEIGTFTGYSALAIARGLEPGGRLIACDVSLEWTAIARQAWAEAGVEDRIDLRIGPAMETLEGLPADLRFDLAFLDADKEAYVDYYEALVPRLNPRGVLLADNTLWEGEVTNPEPVDGTTEAIRSFNRHVADDPRTEQVVLSFADGLTLVRKRPTPS